MARFKTFAIIIGKYLYEHFLMISDEDKARKNPALGGARISGGSVTFWLCVST